MEQSRAPAVVAVAAVTAIAVVVAGAVVAWARLAEGRTPGRPAATEDEPVPTELAGGYPLGDVPPEVAAGRAEPVVAVRVLDEVPEEVRGCDGHDVGWVGAPETELVLATPDSLYISMVGEVDEGFAPGGMSGRWRVTCSVDWDGRGWRGSMGSSMGPVEEPGGFGGGMSCCDEQGRATQTADLAVLEGSAWALQERGGWWLAYPVEDLPRLTLTWKVAGGGFGMGPRTAPAHVVFLDARGQEIGEQWVGG